IGAHLLFPNIIFTTGRDSMQFTTLRPTGPGRCELDSLVLCEPGATSTTEGEGLRRRVPGGVLDEDLSACEGMQANVHSSRFVVGPLAQRHEQPITLFHRALLEAMGRDA
ncbi:MAG TPA: RHO alpha subunit C-terminal catalytic domain-containing protein, partial [Acidimicrobiales bacterium]